MTEEIINPIVDNLQDHSFQLKKIIKIIKNLEKKFDLGKRSYPPITKDQINAMELLSQKCLRKVADLSTTRSEIQTKLNDYYTKTYNHSPAMGKKLFLDHYFTLHKPYDDIKDKIWKLIFSLAEYKEQKF